MNTRRQFPNRLYLGRQATRNVGQSRECFCRPRFTGRQTIDNDRERANRAHNSTGVLERFLRSYPTADVMERALPAVPDRSSRLAADTRQYIERGPWGKTPQGQEELIRRVERDTRGCADTRTDAGHEPSPHAPVPVPRVLQKGGESIGLKGRGKGLLGRCARARCLGGAPPSCSTLLSRVVSLQGSAKPVSGFRSPRRKTGGLGYEKSSSGSQSVGVRGPAGGPIRPGANPTIRTSRNYPTSTAGTSRSSARIVDARTTGNAPRLAM